MPDSKLQPHAEKLTRIRSDYYDKKLDAAIVSRDLAHVTAALNAVVDSFLETDLASNPNALFRILELRNEIGSIDREPSDLAHINGKPNITAFRSIDPVIKSIEYGFFSSWKL